jgi:hypothetical protein
VAHSESGDEMIQVREKERIEEDYCNHHKDESGDI